MFSKDFERSFLAKLHRISPHLQLAKLCTYVLRFKQFYNKNNSSLPAHLWLVGHMHEFVQQRFSDEDQKKKPTDDLFQLMLDAVQSDEVGASITHLKFYYTVYFISLGSFIIDGIVK